METKLKGNLSNMWQKKLSKFRNDETLAIKPADNGGALVKILSTSHYQNMIMQHLFDENTYNNLDPCMDKKIQSFLLRFLRQYKICLTKPDWKFLNNTHPPPGNKMSWRCRHDVSLYVPATSQVLPKWNIPRRLIGTSP